MSMHNTEATLDVEAQRQREAERLDLEWENITFNIRGKVILDNVSGKVSSGEMLAVMGPSGAGKSSILDVLSRRTIAQQGFVTVNGDATADMSNLAFYVEQDDALLGVLSVEETINFAARLSLNPSTPSAVIRQRVEETIVGLGLTDVRKNRIGNVVQRGISGGQKRRVTIGSGLVTKPRILLLDEPTSGLDSRTSREVLVAIKDIARKQGMIVIASIHQPNWETLSLFDKLLLLAQGKTMFFGAIDQLDVYLDRGLHCPVPRHANPTDHAVELVNTDFVLDAAERSGRVTQFAETWNAYASEHHLHTSDSANIDDSDEKHKLKKEKARVSVLSSVTGGLSFSGGEREGGGMMTAMGKRLRMNLSRTAILMQRNMLNYNRNLLAYGVRFGMYLSMGVFCGTIWVNLGQTSDKVNDRLAVLFYSIAFLGFMSVAGVPAFLEERQVFVRERMNGLYGPGPYALANTLVSVPYLFACVVVFCVLTYWSIGLHPGAARFFKFTAVIFLSIFAAESQCAMVSALIPIFVAALAVTSFINGFWMCVAGFLLRTVDMPRFWYYWSHWIDFESYGFYLLIFNDFRGLTFGCQTQADGSCFCDFPSSLIAQGQCALAGEDVLNYLGANGISFSLYVVILLLITLAYRVLFYLILVFKKR
ncbi:hypothetical protein EIP91_002040 [Steccherinum ochraceum]|uniref:ABC transporter domain-containing protein n=1 Tax=Steccherinum ochraceum TaxID=92696 RepID=A0A4R0RCS0_9APHY|nr:hypothetical protein EIP91_002040 [Steccherinum ochraceum]